MKTALVGAAGLTCFLAAFGGGAASAPFKSMCQPTKPVPGNTDPAWSPLGRRIAVLHVEDFDVSIQVHGLAKRDVVSLGNGRHPSWSPSGDALVFTRTLSLPVPIPTSGITTCLYRVQDDLFVASIRGGATSQLTSTGDDSESEPAWSPDGTHIGFVQSSQDGTGLAVINSNGSGRRALTWHSSGDQIVDSAPAWSPSGRKLAFMRSRPGFGKDVWTMRADGSRQSNLTRSPWDSEDQPAWSPDGRLIAFVRVLRDGPFIYVMRADGTRLRQLAAGTQPTWSPDSRRIAFTHSPARPPLSNQIWVVPANGRGWAKPLLR